MRTLHVTSPLENGADVTAVQELLSGKNVFGQDFSPGTIDGQFGPASGSASVRAKRWLGYADKDCTPIAGDLLVLFLMGKRQQSQVMKLRASLRARKQKKTLTRAEKVLALCAKNVGVTETPAGSNRTPFGKWFGVDGVYWCNIFVSYIFKLAVGITLCKDFQGPGVYPNGCTYVPTTESWLKATNQWVGKSNPEPGDIAIFNWDGGVPDHIGIVEKYLGGGLFTTFEGNTTSGDSGDQSNGGGVFHRTRSISLVDGFGRLH